MTFFEERQVTKRARSLKKKIKKSKRRGWQKALLLVLFASLVWFGSWVVQETPGEGWPGLSGIVIPGWPSEETSGVGETAGGDESPESDESPEKDELPEVADKLAVHFLDVGQADCILLETQGKYMLIDAGNREDFAVIDAYLRGQGVNRLEMVWLTHPHEDHIGAAARILDVYEVGAVYMREENFDTNLYVGLQEAIRGKVIPLVAPTAGLEVAFGDCRIQVLGPLETSENMNDNSLVMKVTYGETKFLFTGDAERDEEISLLNNGCDVSADVLKIGHHGSDTSTSYYFLREVWPKYAVISVGAGNDYGHPHGAVLSRLEDAEVPVYRTDELGTIVVTSDGTTVTFPEIES